MPITAEEKARLIARHRARKFATHLRAEGWAEPIPREWESMTDEQLRYTIECLPHFGVRRRADYKWEADR